MKNTDPIYLDYAAATPMAPHVLTAMQPYFSDEFYNPSSPYAPAVKVRREYEAAKQQLAEVFGAKGDELIMTAGATESITLAFMSITGHVVTSAIEHPAVLEAAKLHEHTIVPVELTGVIAVEAVAAAIQDDTELVSIGLANSETGTIQSLKKIAVVVENERARRKEAGNITPLLFHTDASQGVGHIDIHVSRLGVDLLTLNASKMYGPKQVGLLWRKRGVKLRPTIVGGGQESGLRSGTENVAGVIGFAAAAKWVTEHRTSESKRIERLRDELEKDIVDSISTAVVVGHKKQRLAGHLTISFPGLDAERLIFLLEAERIYIATGSACSANKGTASHVLTALGLNDAAINGSLRITLGKFTTQDMIERAGRIIVDVVNQEYARINQR